jgi:hypothetical protein
MSAAQRRLELWEFKGTIPRGSRQLDHSLRATLKDSRRGSICQLNLCHQESVTTIRKSNVMRIKEYKTQS